MRRVLLRRVLACIALPLMVGLMVIGSAGTASANHVHVYNFTALNPAGSGFTANGAVLAITGRVEISPTVPPPGTGYAPVNVLWAVSSTAFTNLIWTPNSFYAPGPPPPGEPEPPTPIGIWSYNYWGWGPAINVSTPGVAPGTARRFSIGASVPGFVSGSNCARTTAWCRYTVNGTQTGPWFGMGMQTLCSPPRIYNPDFRPDGPNTDNLVVKNLHFAQFSRTVTGSRLASDDPRVAAAFTASTDPTRGTLNIPPGGDVTISDLAPGIDPSGKQTVIAKGTIQNGTGPEIEFFAQFGEWEGIAAMPAASTTGLITLAMGLGVLGAMYFWRARSRQYA